MLLNISHMRQVIYTPKIQQSFTAHARPLTSTIYGKDFPLHFLCLNYMHGFIVSCNLLPALEIVLVVTLQLRITDEKTVYFLILKHTIPYSDKVHSY